MPGGAKSGIRAMKDNMLWEAREIMQPDQRARKDETAAKRWKKPTQLKIETIITKQPKKQN